MSDVRRRPLATAEAQQEDWWDEVFSVFRKDLRSELRTKAAIAGTVVFALTSMTLLSFMVVLVGFGLTQALVQDVEAAIRQNRTIFVTHHSPLRAQIVSAIYWLVLYFASMAGIPRVFLKEEETRTVLALRLVARPSAVYTGKLLYNVFLLTVVTTFVLPTFLLFMQPQIESWPLFLGSAYGGALGLAGAGSILGAISAKAHNRGFMMVVLGFGPLLPILVLSVNGMTASLGGGGWNNLVGLVSYTTVMVMVAGFLFEKVWEA